MAVVDCLDELQKIVDSKGILNIDCGRLMEEIGVYALKYFEENFSLAAGAYLQQIVGTKYNNIKRMLEIDNEELFARLANDPTYYLRLPYLPAQDLCRKKWRKTVHSVEYKNMKKNTVRTSNAYQCNKCNGRRIYIYEKQTRSADEPMTTFFECQDCPNRWKK